MARSRVETLLALDEYSRVMGIPGWLFNQVTHPNRETRSDCNCVWLQSGYSGDGNQIVGRDEVARALAQAERLAAGYLGYWPAPKYICDDVIQWPVPRHSRTNFLPKLFTSWGYVQEFGLEATDLIQQDVGVTYTDEDGDGYDDTATITVVSLYGTSVTEKCEVVVMFADTEYEIHNLEVSIDDDGNITITGPRWLFVDPDVWLTADSVRLDDDTSFVSEVDVYRRYTDTTTQASIIWDSTANCDEPPCAPHSVTACCSIKDARIGEFTARPATYSDDDAAWLYTRWKYGFPPAKVSVSYLAGYDDSLCRDCSQMGEALKQALVSLTNVYLINAPCGCDMTMERFSRDRTELEVTTRHIARAQNIFGTSAQGAVRALSVLDGLSALGKGG
jgi:hypothetical protein